MIATLTVGWLTGVWTLIGLVGALFAALNTVGAIHDLMVAERYVNNRPYRLFAVAVAFTEAARLVVQLIFVAIGVLAMLLPPGGPPASAPEIVQLYILVFKWGLVLAAFLTASQTVVIYLARRAADAARLQ